MYSDRARRYMAAMEEQHGPDYLHELYQTYQPVWSPEGEEEPMPFRWWVEERAAEWAQKHQTPVSENRPYLYATEAEWLRAEIEHLRGRLFDLETFWPDWGHIRAKKWFLQQEIERLEARLREVEEREQVRFRASGEGQD